jgi:Putative nuclear localisation signal of quaking
VSVELVTRVERACAQLVRARQPVTFVAVATRAGIGRATLYRDASLRALVNEHRSREREAGTLSGLANEVAGLRISVEAIATKVRRHDEVLRRLEPKKRSSRPRLAG